ncbi:hypothetical protein CALCODRAFT_165063 [Calocera cornea HHB12733]|uniref:Uncharacterized protein n=1 Tax=Calocera cornea HHB12733 TaxID=1353952 RepID=A0A165CI44_9BASI|nr:hypothetical protein CALCODRAFT_165063 [Calocera cornea HHB12733]
MRFLRNSPFSGSPAGDTIRTRGGRVAVDSRHAGIYVVPAYEASPSVPSARRGTFRVSHALLLPEPPPGARHEFAPLYQMYTIAIVDRATTRAVPAACRTVQLRRPALTLSRGGGGGGLTARLIGFVLALAAGAREVRVPSAEEQSETARLTNHDHAHNQHYLVSGMGSVASEICSCWNLWTGLE